MRRFALPAIILLGLLLRVLYGAAVFDYQGNLDWPEYNYAAAEVQRGDFTFSSEAFQLRPPLYPVLIAATDMDRSLLRALNTLFSCAIIPLAYALARRLGLEQGAALLAAGIVALDATSVKYAATVLAEPMASLLLALGYWCMARLGAARGRRRVAVWGLAGGLAIALSALTRPSAYLLWIPMGFWILYARRGQGAGRLAMLALVLPAALGAGLWKLHNAAHYDNSSFTSVGTFNLLHHRAASVLYQATGDDILTVQLRLVKAVESRLGKPTAGLSSHDHWKHRTGSAAQQSVMTDVALEVFFAHPLHYLATIPVGAYRVLLEVRRWPLPLALVWNIGLLALSAAGVWRLARARRWADGAFLLLPCVYFVAGTLLVQTSSIDTRARVMLTPLLAVLAAYGVVELVNRRRAASASLSRPGDS